jgi:predicted lipoprotein with Yx(FWY)xxD motif
MRFRRLGFAGLIVWAGANLVGCAMWIQRAVPVTTTGEGLRDRVSRMTIYTFDRDPVWGGQSRCDEVCVQDWPVVAAATNARRAGSFAIIVRSDGTRQWTYKGKPLYFSRLDQDPADQRGHGRDDLWRIARP